MLYFKIFFFQIIVPILVLGGFAYAFSGSLKKLIDAWKAGKNREIWLYTWVIFIVIYFVFEALRSWA
jgi:hypothetical protein